MNLEDVGCREELAQSIIPLLEKDARVAEVGYYGSMADGTADCYSDIDLRVQLTDVSDRVFAEALPDLVRPVGSLLIEGWGLSALPDQYVRTFYFDAYPLFWHVDIACDSDEHVDGVDIQQDYHWEQMFKIWIDVVASLLRGEDATAYYEGFISRWRDVSSVQDLEPAAKLSQYLDWYAERTRGRGAPCEAVYRRCDEVRHLYLLC